MAAVSTHVTGDAAGIVGPICGLPLGHDRLRRRHCARLALRYISFVLLSGSVSSAFVLAFAVLGVQELNDGINLAIAGAPMWAFGLVFDLFVIIWESVRRAEIHPGAVVAFDLIIWLGGLPILFFAGLVMYQAEPFDPGYYAYTNKETMVVTTAVILSLTFPAMLLHFYFFVRGCVNESHRRRDNCTRLDLSRCSKAEYMATEYTADPTRGQHRHSAQSSLLTSGARPASFVTNSIFDDKTTLTAGSTLQDTKGSMRSSYAPVSPKSDHTFDEKKTWTNSTFSTRSTPPMYREDGDL